MARWGEILRGIAHATFGGCLSRSEFIARFVLYVGLLALVGWPLTTFLNTSTKTFRDLYIFFAVIVLALSLFGILRSYVQRVRDGGWRWWWAPIFLVAPALALGWLGSLYVNYRGSDLTFDPLPTIEAITWTAFAAALALALWRGAGRAETQPAGAFFRRNRLELLTTALAVLTVIPSAIYGGLFQDGVWIERTDVGMPITDSGRRHKLVKCWNLKGIGAGTEGGPVSGIYRDGYEGQVIDFFRAEDGSYDLAFLGGDDARSFREQGFQVRALNIANPDAYDLPDRFMITATYGGEKQDTTVNFTTFAFARTPSSMTSYQMIMTTSLMLPKWEMLPSYPKVRARLMIADCQRVS